MQKIIAKVVTKRSHKYKIIGSWYDQNDGEMLTNVEIGFSRTFREHCHQIKNIQEYLNEIFKFKNIQEHFVIRMNPGCETERRDHA